MLRRFNWYWKKVFQITDLSIIVITWLVTWACFTQYDRFSLPNDLSSILIVIVCWTPVARPFSLYQSRRLMSMIEEIMELTVVVSVYSLLINLLIFFKLLTHPAPLIFALFVWLGVVGFHIVLRLLLRYIRLHGLNQRRVIICGAGAAGQQTAHYLTSRPQTGMRVVGFLDDELSHQTKSIQYLDTIIPVLGRNEDVQDVVREQEIQEVIIALPYNAYERQKELIMKISDLPVIVHVVPDLLDVIAVKAHSEVMLDVPVISVRQPCIEGSEAAIKRAIDIVVSLLALLVFVPIMVIIGILIKLDSKGPILFRQERIGLNGKAFRIYKFRTMVIDAEKRLDQLIKLSELDQPAFKIQNDPRVTGIGRFLRRTSIDELPQLINVLRGEMSLVGPRPEEVRIVRMYSYEQRHRLTVKPGITGPMQVNGRGDLGFDERLELEINYIKHYSLFRDLVLLAQTIPAVIFGKGAH